MGSLDIRWFLLGVLFGALVVGPGTVDLVSDQIPEDKVAPKAPVIILDIEDIEPAKPKPEYKPTPKLHMAAGELVSFWEAWERCEGAHCID